MEFNVEYRNVYVTNSTTNDGAIEVNIFFAIFIPILILVTSALNLATIAAFWKIPSLRMKPGDLLILNLSVVDLVTGIILLPISAPLHITPNHWPTGESGCKVAICVLNLCIHGSLFALTTISIDRFLLVFMEYPKYLKTVTREKVYKIIAAGWIFACITVGIEVGLWEKAKDIDESAKTIPFHEVCLSPARRIQAYSLSIFLLLYLFPVLLVCAFSIGFLFQLRKRLQNNISRQTKMAKHAKDKKLEMSESTTSSSTTLVDTPDKQDTVIDKDKSVDANRNFNQDHHQVRNRYIKPGITLVSLVIAMGICMLPYCFYVIITESGCELCNNTKVLYGLLLLQFCNACLDPFIYVLTRKEIRRFYINLAQKIKNRLSRESR